MFINDSADLAGRQAAVKGRLSACRSRANVIQRYIDTLEATAEPTTRQVGQSYRLAQVLADATATLVTDPLFTENAQEEGHAN